MIYTDQDGNLTKKLKDGRVLRVQERMFNTIMTLSNSIEDPGWTDGW